MFETEYQLSDGPNGLNILKPKPTPSTASRIDGSEIKKISLDSETVGEEGRQEPDTAKQKINVGRPTSLNLSFLTSLPTSLPTHTPGKFKGGEEIQNVGSCEEGKKLVNVRSGKIPQFKLCGLVLPA